MNRGTKVLIGIGVVAGVVAAYYIYNKNRKSSEYTIDEEGEYKPERQERVPGIKYVDLKNEETRQMIKNKEEQIKSQLLEDFNRVYPGMMKVNIDELNVGERVAQIRANIDMEENDISDLNESENVVVNSIFDEMAERDELEESMIDPSDGSGIDIYDVSWEEFSNDHMEYDKLSITYFQGDNVLMNDDGEELDINATIGEDMLEYIIDFKNRDVFYIRNEVNKTDYEVTKIKGTYVNSLLGLDE